MSLYLPARRDAVALGRVYMGHQGDILAEYGDAVKPAGERSTMAGDY